MLPRKPPRNRITQAIQGLIRFFEPISLLVYRITAQPYGDGGLPGDPTKTTIYQGEALFAAAGQRVELTPEGLIQSAAPRILIPGKRDIRQGDRLDLDGIIYEVTDPTNRWGAFTLATLRQVTG